jgi:hypothetical protein
METVKETLNNASIKIKEGVDNINNTIDKTVFGEEKKEEKSQLEPMTSVEMQPEQPFVESSRLESEPKLEPPFESSVEQESVPEPEPEPEEIKQQLTEIPIESLEQINDMRTSMPMVEPSKTMKRKYKKSTKSTKSTKKKRKCKKGHQRNRKTHRCNKKCPPGKKPSYTRTSRKRKCVKKI